MAPIPSVPVLVPLGGATQEGATPTLDWQDVAGAASYTVEYASDPGFLSAVAATGILESQFTIPTPLVDGTFYWRVKAVGPGGESGFSLVDSFVIIPLLSAWTVAATAMAMILYAGTRLGGTTTS